MIATALCSCGQPLRWCPTCLGFHRECAGCERARIREQLARFRAWLASPAAR